MGFQIAPQMPNKCPYKGCKAEIKKDFVLGVVPRCPSDGSADVHLIMRCLKCKRTFGFGMPVVVVNKFIASLPDGKGLVCRRLDPKKSQDPLTDQELKKLEEITGKDLIESFRLADEDQEMFGYYDEDDEEFDDSEEEE